MPPRNLPDHYYYSSKTEATSSATSRPMLGKMYAQSQGEKTPGIWANAFNARDDKLKKVIVKEWSLKKSSDCDDIRLFKDALRFLAFHGGELFLLQEHGIVPLDLNHFHKGHITAIPILPEAECYQIAHRDLKISADQTLLFDLKERRRLTNFLGYTDCLECEIDSYPLAVIESLSEQELQQLKRLKPHEQIKTIYYEYSSNYTATHVRAILKRFYENTNHPEIHLIASNQIPLHFSDIERLVKSSLITKLSACIDNETIAPMLLLEPQYRAKIGILTVKVEESEMTAENVARLKELYPTQVKFILGEFSAGLNILPVLSELDNITISAFTKEMTAQMQAPLPKLRYLTLKDSSYKIVRKQFQSCLDNAANLRTITISYLPELLSIDRHNTLEELVLREIDVRLIQLKRNSFPNLKRLILDDIQCLGDDLDGAKVAVVNIIASAPNLRYLNIIDCTSSDINILEIESIIDVILAHIPSGCIIEVDMKKKPGDKTSVLYPKMVPKKVAAAYARGILIRFCNFRFDFNNGGSWNWQMSNLQRCEQISLDSITMIGSYREAYDLYEKLRRFKDVQKIEFENSTLFFPGIDELTLAHIFQANKFTLNNLRYFSVDFKSYIITQILLQIIATMPYVETLSLTHKFDQPLTKEDVIQLYQLKYLKHLNVIEDLLGSEAKQFLREIPPPFTVEYYSINTQRAIQPLNTRNNFTQQRKSQPKYSYVDMRYGSSSSNSISLNTKLTKKTFKLTPYFVRYPPQEGVCLRQKVERYNPSTCSFEPIVKDERDLTILKAFHIGTTSLQFNPDKFNLVENRNYNFHPGREGGYQFKKNEWVCIFTEEEYDKLLSVAVITTKKVNFTVARGKEGNYYVRADQTMTANVQALLATPYYLDAKNKITSYALPPEIESLVQEISAFGIDYSNASDNTIVNSGSSFFNSSHNNKVAGSEENRRRLKQLYKGEVGNCLQRAQVLLYKIALLQQRYPHCEFQMPSGSGHAWPEWRPAAHLSFQRCDRLGGYPTGEDYQSSSFFAEQISKSATHKVNNAKVPGKEKGKAPLKEDQNDSVDKKVQYGHPKITIADMTEMLSQHSNDSVGFNQLLSIKDTKEIFAVSQALSRELPHRTYIINDQERLRPTHIGQQITGDTWEFSATIPSELKLFLQQKRGKPLNLLLDLPHQALVKNNSLFDLEANSREINGMKIPANTIVVTIVPSTSSCFNDGSIITRHHRVYTVEGAVERPPTLTPDENDRIVSIPLFASSDWLSFLVGYCDYDSAGEKVIVKGGLLNAYYDKKTAPTMIHLLYPPKGDRDFELFVEEFNNRHGFYFEGKWFSLQLRLNIVREEPSLCEEVFPFSIDCRTQVTAEQFQLEKQNSHIVTQSTFERCWRITKVINGKPCGLPGWIQQAENKALSLYIVTPLTDMQWFFLLYESKKYQIAQLQFFLAPTVDLPESIKKLPIVKINECPETNREEPRPFTEINTSTVSSLVYTTDALECGRALELQMIAEEEPYCLFDMSELSDEDVIYSIEPIFDHETWSCARRISDIFERLKAGETVILAGNASLSLIDHLSTLFCSTPYLVTENEQVAIKGRLILITENPLPLQHWMRAENIFSNPIVPEETVEVKPIHLPIYPDNFDPRENQSWTEEEFNQVDIAQITLIREFFKDKHFLYLEGPAGSGKTTLMRRIADYYPDEIEAWLTTQEKGKILGMDEVTFLQNELTIFQSMHNAIPQVLYKGKIYLLTNGQKIIFAGNPLDHGGNRHIPLLFKRYPQNTVHCTNLPWQYLEYAIVRKIFSCSYPQEELAQSSRDFLQQPAIANRDIRTLQSHSMLTCYDHLVENNKIEEIILSDVSNDYVLTSSREEAKLAIVEALKIQQFKQWAAKQSLEVDKLHPAVYGGHSGVVLEGDPGTGKTALIKTMLQACGYNLVLATDNNDYSGQKVYYQLTAANMDTVIDKAFQEGAILFADEINTFMTAELNEKLNAYLSGHALNKQPPRTPGFTVLAGMNPAYFNGRDELELAFRSRVRDVFVASYTHHDVEEIIDKKVSGANVRYPALAECRAKQGWWSQQQADKRQGLAEGGIRKMDECVAEAVEKSRNGHGFNRRTLGPK